MPSNIQITQRDLRLIQWINASGFVSIDLIADYLQIARSTAYGRVRKLVAHHYLLHEQIFHGVLGIYRASLLGVQISTSALPPLRNINKATYSHDLMVVAISLVLQKRFGGEYIAERLLRQELGGSGFGKTGHVPDGVLLLEGQRIAIEVELQKKGRRRREKIFREYMKRFDYDGIWYFCGNREIENQLKSFQKNLDILKLYSISEFLPDHFIKRHMR